MHSLRLIGRLDHNFAWREGGAHLTDDTLWDPAAPPPVGLVGAVAGVGNGVAGRYRVLRDTLGLNKLFWSSASGDGILVAARPQRLVEAGCPFESIRAIPPGSVVDFDLTGGCARVHRLDPGRPATEPEPRGDLVATLAAQIRSRLERYCAALAAAYPHTPVFVCLSGGLDSTGIAVLARDHFPNLTAVSFDLRHANGHISDDRRTAERLAQDLDLPLLRVTATEDDVLEALDTVLVEGIDWRDFNVHAALVNACLARAIAGAAPRGANTQSLVLTGDLANEFLVDYHAETYRGRVFYRLPRLAPTALRAMLVRGVETSHREAGPFEAWGVPVVQPYAAAADLFVALPAEFLTAPDRKERLSRLVFGARIPAYVYARGKARAQVGDGDLRNGAGVLGICADRGLDDQWLRRRFAELHGVRDLSALDRFIRGGRYRAGIPLLQEDLA